MDSEITTTTPNGSPILAYGQSTGPKLNLPVVAAAFGLIVLIALGASIWLTLRMSIPLPEHALLIAAVRGKTPLPEDAPTVWKEAVSGTVLPVILGLTSSDGQLEPFALIPRWQHTSVAVHQTEGLYTLESAHTLTIQADRSMAALIPYWFQLVRAPAYIDADLSMLGENGHLRGPINAGSWNTDFRISSSDATALPDGDISIDLKSLPDAWPTIQEALGRSGLIVDIAETPSEIGWIVSSGSLPLIQLQFAEGPSSSTKAALAAAAGVTQIVHTELPDGSALDTLELPTTELQTGSSTSWEVASGTTFSIVDHVVSIKNVENPIPPVEYACKQGRPILTISQRALDRIRQQSTIQLFQSIGSIEAVEIDGKMTLCMK